MFILIFTSSKTSSPTPNQVRGLSTSFSSQVCIFIRSSCLPKACNCSNFYALLGFLSVKNPTKPQWSFWYASTAFSTGHHQKNTTVLIQHYPNSVSSPNTDPPTQFISTLPSIGVTLKLDCCRCICWDNTCNEFIVTSYPNL